MQTFAQMDVWGRKSLRSSNATGTLNSPNPQWIAINQRLHLGTATCHDTGADLIRAILFDTDQVAVPGAFVEWDLGIAVRSPSAFGSKAAARDGGRRQTAHNDRNLRRRGDSFDCL